MAVSYAQVAFSVFVTMLVCLMFLHKQKNFVVYGGFSILAGAFMYYFGANHFVEHMTEHHRSHLLLQLFLLLPGFSMVAHYFEHSGAAGRIARMMRSDSQLLWTVFVLSIFLDNIAAAMIGAKILVALYGQGNVPFRLIIATVAASNLGGAGSFLGDTTSVMIYLSGISPLLIAKAFAGTIPAQFALNMWASRHESVRLDAKQLDTRTDALLAEEGVAVSAHSESEMNVRYLFPLLGIPGLVAGNIMDQPGPGLWIGFLTGVLLGNVWKGWDWKVFGASWPNTIFLLVLVGAAELLPLDVLKPTMEANNPDVVAYGLGVLSAFFDNIPLTAIAISLGGFGWGFLSFCVGFGGSATWFGSSAGVAIGNTFHEAHDTKRWIGPFFVIEGIYAFGALCYILVFRVIVPAVTGSM